MQRKKAISKAKLKTVDSAKHRYQPFKKVRGVSSLYRYYSRNGKAGSYYMIARIDGELKKECLETNDLDFAKKKNLLGMHLTQPTTIRRVSEMIL